MSATPEQDARYAEAAALYGAMMQRLARANEADPDRRRDLLQEMHLALWRSLAAFDGRCALSTWVYRVAHNTAAIHVGKQIRANKGLVPIEAIEALADQDFSAAFENNDSIERLNALIRTLRLEDRQLLTLYLEGLDAAETGDVMGLSANAVATRLSRLKTHLARLFRETAHA